MDRRHPHPPVTGRPDTGMAIRVHLATSWQAADGTVRPIRTHTTAHLFAIAGYLRWWAPELRAMDPVAPPTADPAAYLCSLPVFCAVEAELRARNALLGDLLDVLRVEGPVPWEQASPGTCDA